MSRKTEYVKAQADPQERCPEKHPSGYSCMKPAGHFGNHVPKVSHHCHWPGCTKEVPPAMWGCKPHWFALPIRLRNMVWAAYEPGQEITKTPSAEYLEVARQVQEWIASGGRA